MALIVGAIVNMTSTLPTQAHHTTQPMLYQFSIWDADDSDVQDTDRVNLLNAANAGATSTVTASPKCGPNATTSPTAEIYNCAVTFKTDVKKVVLSAIPGNPVEENGHTGADTANYVAQSGSRDFPTTANTGLTFTLEEGLNTLQVRVKHKTKGTTQTYTLSVTREANARPNFDAANGVASPVRNNRFVYGYAEDLMKKVGGYPTQGSTSRYNHPSDGTAYNADSTDTYYRKNTSTKHFALASGNFTATTLAFTAIIAQGKTPEGTETGENAHLLRDTNTVNLSDGIVITASQDIGEIYLPQAFQGNDGTYTYELKQVGPAGSETNMMPDNVTQNFIVWTDATSGVNDNNKVDYPGSNTAEPQDTFQYTTDVSNIAEGSAVVGIRLTGASPQTDSTNSADKSTHSMVYRAHDGDADKSTSDGAEVYFNIVIQKAPAASTTPGDDDEPAANELDSLVVGIPTNPPLTAVTNSAYTPREAFGTEMTPDFDSDVTSYRVRVPYEVENVIITATKTGATLEHLSSSGNSVVTSGMPFNVSELTQGSNDTIRIRVTPPESSKLSEKTYSIIISRDYNTPAQFDTSEKPGSLNFYDGVAIDPVDLPGGRLGNGETDGTSATAPNGDWRYDLALSDRYDTGASAGRGTPGFPYTTDKTDDNETTTPRAQPTGTTWMGATGLSLTSKWDATAKTAQRQMVGTPVLLNVGARSKNSEYTFLYVAKDGDLDDRSSDNAEHTFKATVWRNVLLQTLEVDVIPGTSVTSVGGMVYNRDDDSIDHAPYTDWNKTSTYSYEYTVNHDVSQVTIKATNMGTDVGFVDIVDGEGNTVTEANMAGIVVASPADADSDLAGHQVDLSDGNNPVTIEVTNGGLTGTHELTIYRKPLGANLITVTALAGDEKIKLTPAFEVTENTYSGTVESHQDVVRIDVTTTHPTAQVSVNYIDAGRDKSAQVDVYPGVNAPFRIDVTLGSSTTTYFLNITRKGNVAPSFGSADVMDSTRQVGKALATCDPELDHVLLPEATEGSGNGALAYSIDATKLPDGINFDPATRKLTGTPVLREAYERSYEIPYVVSDGDTDRSSNDTDTITFTMTVTHATTDKCGDTGTVTVPKNRLTNLLVIYDLPTINKTDIEAALDPDFDSAHPTYTVDLPHGSTNKRIAAYVHTGATVSLNQIAIAHGVHTPLRQDANTIRVSYPELTSETYSLTIAQSPQSVPAFTEPVSDQTWQVGTVVNMALPVATGGNTPPALTYTLADEQKGQMPTGLSFNAETRVLSGTANLSNVDSANNAVYRMVYTVMDRDGDKATDTFNITITTDPVDVANPGSKPMSLNVVRTGTSANLTWNAGDDASSQAVVALQLSDVAGTVKLEPVAANAETYRLTGLQTGNYIFWVVGYDSSGSYKDADGNLYSDIYIEQ